jgi:predicted Rossmann-fold nucleotide-binding protein
MPCASPPERHVCVFCGSAPGTDPAFVEAARNLGASLARAGLGVVYGGATVGLMGAVADAALSAGGHVIGVIPSGERPITGLPLTPAPVYGDYRPSLCLFLPSVELRHPLARPLL